MEQELANLDIPSEAFECRDIKCSDEGHTASLDAVTEDLLKSINKAAKDNLCITGGKKKPSKQNLIPGWKEIVLPYQDSGTFCG